MPMREASRVEGLHWPFVARSTGCRRVGLPDRLRLFLQNMIRLVVRRRRLVPTRRQV